jgi:hypothetical protein
MGRDNVIKNKTFEFAKEIVYLYKVLVRKMNLYCQNNYCELELQ